MHVRTLDCKPVPQDLLHLEYDPQGVHWPAFDVKADIDPTLSPKKMYRTLS